MNGYMNLVTAINCDCKKYHGLLHKNGCMECSDCLFPYCSIFASIVDQARKLADEQGSSWKEVLNNTYIYWKLQEVNSSEHFISVYLRYYFLNDGIWSCGPSGTVKYVLNSTSGIEGCEIICQKEYSSEDLLFLLNDKIVGWNKIEANIWDQAKREYATLLKNSWKEQNIDEHEATLIRPFLVNTIFLSIQLVKNKVSCPKSS